MGSRGANAAGWRGAFVVLALVALAMQTLVPPGYMVSGSASRPFAVVICTGHGPVLSAADLGSSKAPPGKTRDSGPCTLTAHGSAAPLPTPSAVPVGWAWLRVAAPTQTPAVFPGRGLAAPPPARAPPALLT